MSRRCDFMSHLAIKYIVSSSYWPPNSTFQFAYYDVSIFTENWLFLCRYWSIFLLKCWYIVLTETIALQIKWLHYPSFWHEVIMAYFLRLKVGMSDFLTFCVLFSMGHDNLVSKHGSTWHSRLSRAISPSYLGSMFNAEPWVWCSWDN